MILWVLLKLSNCDQLKRVLCRLAQLYETRAETDSYTGFLQGGLVSRTPTCPCRHTNGKFRLLGKVNRSFHTLVNTVTVHELLGHPVPFWNILFPDVVTLQLGQPALLSLTFRLRPLRLGDLDDAAAVLALWAHLL